MSVAIRKIVGRVATIWRYASVAHGLADCVPLGVLGFARANFLQGRDPLSRLVRRLFPVLAVRPAALGGLSAVLDPSDWTQVIIFDELVLDGVYNLSLVPFRPDHVVDCGGHIGLFTLLADRRFRPAQITVFEPNPHNVHWVREQVRVNRLAVRVVAAAVSDHDGENWFAAEQSFGGRLYDEAVSVPVGGWRVPVVNLPAMIRRLRSEQLLLKIDVEGEEVRLIPALLGTLPRQCAIFFETHGGESSWFTVAGALERDGFAVTRLRDRDAFSDGFALRQ